MRQRLFAYLTGALCIFAYIYHALFLIFNYTEWCEQVACNARSAYPDAVRLILYESMPGDWDCVFVFPPYTPSDEVERICKYQSGALNSTIESSDSVCLLVFMLKDDPVRELEIPRGTLDFSTCGKLKTACLRRDAVFTVKAGKSGNAQVIASGAELAQDAGH